MRRTRPVWPAAAGSLVLTLLVLPIGSVLLPVRSALADSPAPKKKDSSPRIKPRTAELTASVEPSEAKPGDTVTFKVTAKLEPGNHIYKHRKDSQAVAGPVPTTFDLFDTGGLEVQGDWTASKEAIQHKDTNFADLPFVEYHEDEVTWSIKLKVPPGAAAGKKTLQVQVGYMVCNDKVCMGPGRWTLPAATLTVAQGDGAAKPAEPAAKQAAAAPEKRSPSAGEKAPAASESPRTTEPSAAVVAQSKPPESPSSTPAASGSSDTGSSPKTKSEIAQKAEQGLIPFLIASAIGGLFALVMPCVWPMVPITVNFFVKQGQSQGGRGKATSLAVIYCLSIIGVFTAVGVFFSFFFSASALQTLANNPWLNFVVAGLFIVFGLSLLGLFEIRLPSFLLNASSKGESRGGVIGVVFMALTLTITSFTCTFPVVGGLLVMAAQGNFLYPIVGLATFAAVLALPFFLLALSPTLISKMPRGGDWMNAVKVVGGLIEIGAALKFINTAELAFVTPENAWFNAHVVLASWIALSIVSGLYLLGVFRTDHDHDDVKVGPGRLVSGAGFLGLALFLLPALFGHAPQSQLWNRVIVGLLPPDSDAFNAPVLTAGQPGATEGAVKATSTDPAQAEREQKSFHGVQWGWSLEQAKEQAVRENRPILVDFTGVNCPNCRQMERGVFRLPNVVALLRKFVTVQLYTDFEPIDSITPEQREERAVRNQDLRADMAGESTNPFYVVLSPSGQVIDRIGGYNEPGVFVGFLNKALEKASHGGGEKVAQAGSAPQSTGRPSSASQ
jgi:thiol:disulfide interchange protein